MRTILRTYPSREIAEIMAARLRDLDLPIVVQRAGGVPEVTFGTGGLHEVILEDESVLENETWRQQIEEVLSSDSSGLSPEEEEAISKMPVVDYIPSNPDSKPN